MSFWAQLKDELKYEITGIGLFTMAGLLAYSLFSANPGAVGGFFARILRTGFGYGALFPPALAAVAGGYMIVQRRPVRFSPRWAGLLLLMFASLPVFHLEITWDESFARAWAGEGGGLLGALLLAGLRGAFGEIGSFIVFGALALIALLLLTGISLITVAKTVQEKIFFIVYELKDRLLYRRMAAATAPTVAEEEAGVLEDTQPIPVIEVPAAATVSAAATSAGSSSSREARELIYRLPHVNLLKKNPRIKTLRSHKEIADNTKILEETLESFGVSGKVIQVSQGPAITRYELQPAPGVKVSRIVSLADDIALKLASSGVRIEAPIPGKAAIGIEVPNRDVSTVFLREVLETEEFQQATSKLTVALGKDIAGTTILTDLAKMPHLLVAGATGSGKSVCINTLILSILFKAAPHEVKFLLIDPKVVELSTFNGIPHLVAPVVTDAKKAASALRWVVQEMEQRYNRFAAASVRDISRYNEMNAGAGALPYIVVIIDELADLMMVAPVDIEDAICRLAQMARAAGIHLVLATQRPSVDVITGTIKANVPSRIAFAVSSQVDSRTILDMNGAEKLLGKGDMLFYPVGASKPVRVQGAFVSDTEVEEVVAFVNKQCSPQFADGVFSAEIDGKNANFDEDELLEDAIRLVLEAGQASVSMLQRRFRIGYTRAARLIDIMEEMRIVGPNVGSKARDVIMTSDQVYLKYFKK